MDFDLSEEQTLLQDSIRRFMSDRYGFEARRRYQAQTEGWSVDVWTQFAELGLLGIAFAEDEGGFGGGAVETMLVMEAIGRALVVEPYLATVVLAGGLLRHAGSSAQRAALLPGIADGSSRLAFAHAERQAGHDLHDVATTALRAEDGAYVVSGAKSLVLHGDSADRYIVSARTGGDRRDRQGLSLFVVDATAPGLSRRGYPTQDGMRAAEVTLTDVRVAAGDCLGEPGQAFPAIERVIHEAIAAIAAEAVGAMAEAVDMTVDYLKTRTQFSTTIGTFQVLQHRAADMLVALEQARSMALFATMMAAEDDPDERRKAISAAKVQIGRSGTFIAQQAVQLHGGIGMTMEYKLGHLMKRLTMINTQFGDPDHHLEAFAETDGFISAR